MISLSTYSPSDAPRWDTLVSQSKNGTFLLKRAFMDYHSDRFTDCSMMFEKKGRTVGLLPANYVESDQIVCSHQGLTYGGLILDKTVTATDVMEMFDLMLSYCSKELNASRLIYKPVPYIYCSYPSDEDRYAVFRHEGRLTVSNIATVIDMKAPLPYTELRRRCIKKGEKAGLQVMRTHDAADYRTYWNLLSTCLESRHHATPVHSADEMLLLQERFPEDIALYICKSSEGELLAGTWLFISRNVVHTQYLANSDTGKQEGALDLIIHHIISNSNFSRRYLDFGTSNEQQGRYLNEQLAFQKEGFGGRGVCYDTWEIHL